MERIVLFQLLVCAVSSATNDFKAIRYPGKISDSKCDQRDPLLDHELLQAVNRQAECLPVNQKTCKDVLRCNPSAGSGHYTVSAGNGSKVHVYCDMEGTNCGGEGGWMRVAYLNVTDPSSQCPNDFKIETANNKSFCIRSNPLFKSKGGCSGVWFETYGHPYSQVCGYIRGYAYGSTDALEPVSRNPNLTLSDGYFDGVSITYDSPPSHIWTYTSGLAENENDIPSANCPCNVNVTSGSPQYVGNNYYCESALPVWPKNGTTDFSWYTDDVLWDGQKCRGIEGPCCNSTRLPWFTKSISPPTSANINARVCLDQLSGDEDIGLEAMELYVKP